MPLSTTTLRGVVMAHPDGGEMESTMKIHVTRPMFVAGRPVAPGDEIDVDELVAGRLIGMGKAKAVAERETAEATPTMEVADAPAAKKSAKPPAKKSSTK